MRIREFQDLIRRTYHDRDAKRGLDLDFIWFTEEVGELAEAVRKRDVASMKEEAADVFAWLVTCCSLLGVDVEEAALAKYGKGCPLRGDPLPMRVALAVVLTVLLPALVFWLGWRRYRAKVRRMDAFHFEVQDSLVAAGFTPIGEGYLHKDWKGIRFELHPNPLLRAGYTLRIGAFSDTLHDLEFRRGGPRPTVAGFAPLLERWESCGKHDLELWMAAVVEKADVGADATALWRLARTPIAKEFKGGTITFREGFEADCPQGHWRHDLKAKLPPNVRRFCVSYWQDDPLLTLPMARLLHDLAGESRIFTFSDTDDLRFLEMSFERRDIAIWGTMVELKKPELLAAADRHTDGGFFGGCLAARELPKELDGETIPKFRWHETALKVWRKCDFYARRLYDFENAWYSGEYEILTVYPLDVRGAVDRMAQSLGAQVMDIDRRFHKRLVKPLDW